MECFRGVVYPWHCDHLGHMNVQHYTGMFDQAAFHLQHVLGLSPSALAQAGETAVEAQHTVRFLNEQLAGSLVVVDGALNKDAAWYYAAPKDAARHIAGHIAFWKGVEVR